MRTYIALLALAAAAAGCRCNDPEPAPDASTSSMAPSSTAPKPAPTPAPSAAPAPAWEPVLELNTIHGWWGQGEGEEAPKGPWADIRSREVAQATGARWELPYPWQIDLKADEFDKPANCGFFEKIQDDGKTIGWRVAYCIDGPYPTGKRTAERVYFSMKKKEAGNGKLLRVRMGDVVVDLSRDLP